MIDMESRPSVLKSEPNMSNSPKSPQPFRVVGLPDSQPKISELVTLQVRDLFPLLQDAIERRRIFLEDFGDDTIKVTRDLYEVLITYQRCLRDEAA